MARLENLEQTRQILLYLQEGKYQAEIARLLGINRASLNEKIFRLRARHLIEKTKKNRSNLQLTKAGSLFLET